MSDWGEDRLERAAKIQKKPFSSHLPPPCHLPWVDQIVSKFLKERELLLKSATRNGWYASVGASDTLPRLVIPCRSQNPTNIYWQARLLAGEGLRYQSPYGVQRGDALALAWPEGEHQGLVVCEGPVDALAASELGFLGVGLMGVHPSEEALEHVNFYRKFYSTKSFIILGDRDSEGAAAATRWALRFPGSYLLFPPDPYKDLTEMPLVKRQDLFTNGC